MVAVPLVKQNNINVKPRTDVPKFLATPVESGEVEQPPEEQVWYHNWLYSVVPISERREDWGLSDKPQPIINYPLYAYLTGYCRNCNKAFSKRIDTLGYYSETDMEVPKEGCVAPTR